MHSALAVSQLPLTHSRDMLNFLQCWQPNDINQLGLTREDYFAMPGDSNSCLSIKTLARSVSVEHPEGDVVTKELAMEEQTRNINVVHSVWRQLKKAKFRDLEPTQDVKGGGSVTETSKPATRGTGTAENRGNR
jgi:hypothetical protein